MDLRESLTLSATAGEILTIVYHGGSQPGTKRQIVPIEIRRDALSAMDLSTNKRKQFSINKIEIISHDDTGKAAYVPVRKPRIPKIDSLERDLKSRKGLYYNEP